MNVKPLFNNAKAFFINALSSENNFGIFAIVPFAIFRKLFSRLYNPNLLTDDLIIPPIFFDDSPNPFKPCFTTPGNESPAFT